MSYVLPVREVHHSWIRSSSFSDSELEELRLFLAILSKAVTNVFLSNDCRLLISRDDFGENLFSPT